ncbi:MAG: hypothetical protein ACXWQO_18725 [Bdellovibrionota bacterium]
MKTLITLAALLLSSSAFAYSPSLVTKTLSARNVIDFLDGKNIQSISDGPSYRCMGCYGLILKTYRDDFRHTDTYNLQIQDFGGRFLVNIAKMDDKTAE